MLSKIAMIVFQIGTIIYMINSDAKNTRWILLSIALFLVSSVLFFASLMEN